MNYILISNQTRRSRMYSMELRPLKKAAADYIIAIGGGSSMDTSKAIGIIIANPEFEDVRSLEGTAPTKIHVFRLLQCLQQQEQQQR